MSEDSEIEAPAGWDVAEAFLGAFRAHAQGNLLSGREAVDDLLDRGFLECDIDQALANIRATNWHTQGGEILRLRLSEAIRAWVFRMNNPGAVDQMREARP